MLFHRRLFQIRSFEAIFEVFCLFLPLSGLFLPQIWLKTCRERILAWGLIIYKCQLPNWQYFLSKTTDGLRNDKTNDLNSTNMHNSGFFNGFRPKFRVIPWEFATKLALEKCKFDQIEAFCVISCSRGLATIWSLFGVKLEFTKGGVTKDCVQLCTPKVVSVLEWSKFAGNYWNFLSNWPKKHNKFVKVNQIDIF